MTKSTLVKRLTKANLNLENYEVSHDTISTKFDDIDEDNQAIELLTEALLGLNWSVITTAGGYQFARVGKALNLGNYNDKASAYHY
jgi:hypothetical protein